jgi:Fe2+ transport system protein FeoA
MREERVVWGRYMEARKASSADSYPLDRVPSCTRVEVLAVTGDLAANRRLAQLGLLVGAQMQVLKSAPMGGPVLLEVRGSTVAVGRGLARSVTVRVLG